MRDLLQTGAALLEEPEDVVRREIRDPSSYNAAFTAIASGAAKYSEISSRADLESGNVSGHIKTLELLDLVGKEVPQGDATKNKTQYKITDNFFGFWYRFIPRNLSLIASGHPEIAYRYIEENLDKYMGPVFEQICLEWLWRHNGTNDLPLVFTDAGRWWGGNPLTKRESEVDIVAHNDTGKALLCECKWSINPVGIDVLEHLEDIAEIPHFQKYSTKSFCLFSRSGFTAACLDVAAARSDVFLVSLEDMLAR
jgi:AAA+ ATPase superfamily predicted ATPase